MINVGIIGNGVVGAALVAWLQKYNTDVNCHIRDPKHGLNDKTECDIYFIQVPVETKENGAQDIQQLENALFEIPIDKPVFIRSTITPETFNHISQLRGIRIYYMPEFLSDRTAVEDFENQTLVCTCVGSQYEKSKQDADLFRRVFADRKIIEMSSMEAILAKYIHNIFGALKVTYFNAAYDLARQLDSSYNNIIKCLVSTGHISKTYTDVPGHDGKRGFGGKCFDKDLRAFEKLFRYTRFGKIIEPIDKLNCEIRRNDYQHDEIKEVVNE